MSIEQQPVAIRVNTYKGLQTISAHILAPSIARFSCDHESADPEGQLFMGQLYVDESYRRRGLGRRLFQAIAHTALKQGFTTLYGPVSSPHTFAIMRSLCTEQSVTISDDVPIYNPRRTVLPITMELAQESLDEATQYETSLTYRAHDFIVAIDLAANSRLTQKPSFAMAPYSTLPPPTL